MSGEVATVSIGEEEFCWARAIASSLAGQDRVCNACNGDMQLLRRYTWP